MVTFVESRRLKSRLFIKLCEILHTDQMAIKRKDLVYHLERTDEFCELLVNTTWGLIHKVLRKIPNLILSQIPRISLRIPKNFFESV